MQLDITPNHDLQLFIALPIRLNLDSTDIDAALEVLNIETINETNFEQVFEQVKDYLYTKFPPALPSW